ncbi:hypothetical protein TSUD_73310 [Trifolium subterraneum]|uniref:Uncharacterized protein n=1 Tax=Trifolium subterraneum TaxID=3900 RepID=A0A2Z6LGX7_TRISU|nr:hypothetical protein TSUD_73310 [Trifolium subterraneum]
MEQGWPCWSHTEETSTATERSPKWTGDMPPCMVVRVVHEIHSQGMRRCVRVRGLSAGDLPVITCWRIRRKE